MVAAPSNLPPPSDPPPPPPVGAGRRPTCGCLSWLANRNRDFIPAQRPPEWRLLDAETIPSQTHSDSGSQWYRCDLCGRHITVKWLDRDQFDADSGLNLILPMYWVDTIDPDPQPGRDQPPPADRS